MRFVAAVFLILTSTLTSAAPSDADAVLNCVILPDEQVELGSPVPGVIEHISVRRSDRVKAGQTIARLESSVEQATVALARARATPDTEIELRRVELSYDAQHRDRLHTLQARQAVSSQNMDDAERVAKAAELRVRLAKDKRREATLDERRADALLALKTIVSPIDGVVIQINNHVGEYVETRPVARIARLDPLRVEVIAPLALFGSVHEGMQVAVSPETDPNNERIATVRAVDAVADPGSGTFGIQLELPNPNLELPAGIKCTGRLLPQALAKAHEPTTVKQATPLAMAKATEPTNVHPKTKLADPVSINIASTTELASDAGVSAICLAFGPHENEQQARSLAAAAKQLGGQAELNEIDVASVIGYVVVSEPKSDRLHELAERFREAGVSDLAIINRGVFSGRIALGTYNGPLSAERRSVTLNNLGFDTEVLPRTRTRRAWQVEVHLPDQVKLDVALAKLKRETGDSVMQADACNVQQTAAR